jgi:hypothetical protein
VQARRVQHAFFFLFLSPFHQGRAAADKDKLMTACCCPMRRGVRRRALVMD